MKATKSSQMLALIAAGLVGGTLANNAFAKKPAPKAEASVATEEKSAEEGAEAKGDKQNCAAAKGEKQGCATAKKEKQSCKNEKQSCKGKKAKAPKAETEEHAE
jgi:hypothetical protein